MYKFQRQHLKLKSYKQPLFFALIISLLILLGGISSANDLDDGIPLDDIPYSDDIKPDVCIRCIVRAAKSSAITKSKGKSKVNEGIVIGKGATIKGDVINIIEGKNNKNVAF